MKKWFKRGISILLTFCMCISMAACSKEEGKTVVNNDDAKKNVYSYEDFDLGFEKYEYSNIYNVEFQNDKFYVSCNVGDEYGGKNLIMEVNPDGTELREIEIIQPKSDQGDIAVEEMQEEESEILDVIPEDTENVSTYIYYEQSKVGANETLYCIESKRIEDYSDQSNPIYTQEYSLVGFDFDFNELWRTPLSDYIQDKDNFYINRFLADKNGNIYIFAEKEYMIFDQDGNYQKSVDIVIENWPENMYFSEENDLVVIAWDMEMKNKNLYKVNPQTGEIKETVVLPELVANGTIAGTGMGYDLLVTNSNGLNGFHLSDTSLTPIMNYLNSDLSSAWLDFIYPVDDKTFAAVYTDVVDYLPHFALFTPVDPKDIPDKQVVVLGCEYIDGNIRKNVVDFNKKNQNYRIVIKDYSIYNTSDDWMAGHTQLNNDILAGNIPDIMIIDSQMPVSSYISKGLFADLYEFIDADEELNKEDYLQNIFELYSVDGKLYQLVPSFGISTFVAKEKWVGDRETLSFKEMQDIVNGMPEGASAFGFAEPRENVMNLAFMFSGNLFIDNVKGKCKFDSQEFIDLLEYIKALPSQKDLEENLDWESMWMDYETQWRNDQALLYNVGLSNIWEFHRATVTGLGEEENIIGFPCAPEKGSIVNPFQSFAISSKSSCRDGAWEFLRYYLTDEFQNNIEWGLPIKEDALKTMAMKATERPYYLDENDEKVEYDETIYVGDIEMILNPMTVEEVDEVISFIKSVDRSFAYNEEIVNIINEESAAFFEGQKSVQEVASIIQSRVQIYVDENR